MTVPKIQSSHNAETRNIINRAIDVINQQGRSIQDLVAEGQLTPTQYAELIAAINGLMKSGEISLSDLSEELKKEIEDATLNLSKKADKTFVDTKLTDVNTQLTHIAINPVNHGAKFDGVHDDTQAIINALEEAEIKGDSEVLLSGTVAISSVIEIPQGVTIHSYNATIKPLVDTDVLSFNRNTKVKGNLLIDVSHLASDFTSDVLYFDGTKRLSYRDISLDNVFIFGHTPSGMGNAVHLDCTSPLSDISFIQFNNLVIRGFEKGIFIDAPEISGTTDYNYANGNVFNTLIISDCDYYIYGTGGHNNNRNQASGNWFGNVQLQYNNRAKEIIHLEGRSNVFKGYIWDAAYKDVTILNLTDTSSNNNIEINGSNDPDIMHDNGRDNTINKLDQYYDKVPFKTPFLIGDWSTRFEGDYDDVLNKSDIFHNVSILSGEDNITVNDISQVFDAEGSRYLGLNLSNQGQFKFEIDFNGNIYNGNNNDYIANGLKNIGLVFGNYRVPETIIIEVESNTGEVSTTELDMSKKENRPYVFIRRNSINGLAKHIKKIRITLIGQVGSDVRLARMVASSFYMNGNVFLSTAGGKVTGALEIMDSGLLKIPARPTQLANHEEHHKRMLIVDTPEGEKVMVCLKQSDGSYQWVSLN